MYILCRFTFTITINLIFREFWLQVLSYIWNFVTATSSIHPSVYLIWLHHLPCRPQSSQYLFPKSTSQFSLQSGLINRFLLLAYFNKPILDRTTIGSTVCMQHCPPEPLSACIVLSKLPSRDHIPLASSDIMSAPCSEGPWTS